MGKNFNLHVMMHIFGFMFSQDQGALFAPPSWHLLSFQMQSPSQEVLKWSLSERTCLWSLQNI